MCLRVEGRIQDASQYPRLLSGDTQVSVYVCLMRGEHDDQLKWPFRGDITVQLLNQRRGQEHVEHTITFGNDWRFGVPMRTPRRSYGPQRGLFELQMNLVQMAHPLAAPRFSREDIQEESWIPRFISHSAVESNTWTTQYLHNDCLKWRVTNIVVRSV